MSMGPRLKVPKHQRCYSQGSIDQPESSQWLNVSSPLIKVRSLSSASSIHSANSTDFFNNGFLKSPCSESSVFSTPSNVSTIPNVSCVSSIATSNATVNRAFLGSCSSANGDFIKLSEDPTSIIDAPSTPDKINSLISNLMNKLHKLKERPSSLSSTDQAFGDTVNEIHKLDEKTDKLIDVDVLIDIDVFTPDASPKEEQCKGCIPDRQLDSVFMDTGKLSKSIRHEAQILARTFEELALQSNLNSSIDDLISSNPSWTSELQPAFEDETSVENLIDLLTSPKLVANENSKTKVKTEVCTVETHENNVETLEKNFSNPVQIEKRTTAATLLSDLKKLIKTENNTEATILLENLEKVLSVEHKNNTELLATYLRDSNDLANGAQNSNSDLKVIQNVIKENIENNQKENINAMRAQTENNVKHDPNVNFDELVIKKHLTLDEKCINEVDHFLKASANLITNKVMKANTTSDIICDKDNTNIKDNSPVLNGNVAEELVTNLGNLLNSKSSSKTNIVTENVCTETPQTPKQSKLKSRNKLQSPRQLNTLKRLSNTFNAVTEENQSVPNLINRSASMSSPSTKTTPVLAFKDKSVSQLKEIKKRFPSDPGSINSIPSRKSAISKFNNIAAPVIGKALENESASIAITVKNKLRKQTDIDVKNSKGPLKATVPIANMRRIDSLSKKATAVSGTVTPPKTHKIVSSTPNSVEGEKKSPRTKPVASSTPDSQASKLYKMHSLSNSRKQSISCDISPVITGPNAHNRSGIKSSPKRMSSLSSPKKFTPKRRPSESNIPQTKSLTSPVVKVIVNSPLGTNHHHQGIPESPKRSVPKKSEQRKNSPVPKYGTVTNTHPPSNPLRDSNKLSPKAKPFNLISRLRRNSSSNSVLEKENYL